jgi:hypothetical protein
LRRFRAQVTYVFRQHLQSPISVDGTEATEKFFQKFRNL